MTNGAKKANVQRIGTVARPGRLEDICMRGATISAPTARLSWTCLAVAWLLWPQALVAGLPEGLAGKWRGVVEVASGEADVRASLRALGDGFEVAIELPEARPLRAELVPTERPKVFQAAASRRGLFGFFDGSGRSNPFDGEPLIWARSTAVGIVVYGLTITADGGVTLLRIALSSVDGRLEMAVQERIDADPRTRFDLLLEPAG